jgi:hypothetical protein
MTAGTKEPVRAVKAESGASLGGLCCGGAHGSDAPFRRRTVHGDSQAHAKGAEDAENVYPGSDDFPSRSGRWMPSFSMSS